MSAFLNENEPLIRLGAFLVIAFLLLGWEALAPRRDRMRPRGRRWPVNISIVVIDTVLVRVLFPAAVVAGVAALVSERGWGLLNGVNWPAWVEITLAVLALDLVIYAQHVAMHRIPLLWRLHRMHHMDLDVDFTTALRFHPVEIVLSVVIKFAAVIALGAPVAAVIVFEILLNGSAMFNHANVNLAGTADRIVRMLVVTPDMHRVHHSVVRAETDSNFGFALSLWDRLFGTYRDQPAAGHAAMRLGLPVFRDDADQGLLAVLANPLRGQDREPAA